MCVLVIPLSVRPCHNSIRFQRSPCSLSRYSTYGLPFGGVTATTYIRDLLEDLGHGVTSPTPLLLDSKAAIDLAEDPVAFKKTKHILRHAYELRDRVARGVYVTAFVESALQLADILTKGLRVGTHRDLVLRLLHDSSRQPVDVTSTDN